MAQSKEMQMSKLGIFIQVHGQPGLHEAEVPEHATFGDLQDALAGLGITFDPETFIFIDEAEQHEHGERRDRVPELKRGCRIHISRCKRITVTVNYLDKTAEHAFPPGARVRAVKAWAVKKYGLNPKDAAEHVLQLCNSTERPASDTPLHQLTQGRACAVCFDLVPEKRVEG